MATPDHFEAVRAMYDVAAERYAKEFGGELAAKPLDRALLAAFSELVGTDGVVGDLGCGPGHVTAHLAESGLRMVGLDLAPRMIEVARRDHPGLEFRMGSLTDLPFADGALAGAVMLYSIINLTPTQRHTAYLETARVTRPGGWLLVSFHVSDLDHSAGEVKHVTEWWGYEVDAYLSLLDPAEVVAGLTDAGFAVRAQLTRRPMVDNDYPSERCFLLAQR